MLLGALHLRTSKLFSLRAKRKFYNCSPFWAQNGRKTATTTAPPAKLAPTHATPTPLFFEDAGAKLTNRLHAALTVIDAPVSASTPLSFDSAIPCVACAVTEEGRG